MSYEKPKARPGMVCHYARWDRDGQLREARYRPIEKHAPEMDDPIPARAPRGALAAERQGQLL